jgi:hypothetical protein
MTFSTGLTNPTDVLPPSLDLLRKQTSIGISTALVAETHWPTRAVPTCDSLGSLMLLASGAGDFVELILPCVGVTLTTLWAGRPARSSVALQMPDIFQFSSVHAVFHAQSFPCYVDTSGGPAWGREADHLHLVLRLSTFLPPIPTSLPISSRLGAQAQLCLDTALFCTRPVWCS